MSLEQVRDRDNGFGNIDFFGFKGLHDVQEIIVDLWSIFESHSYLIQVLDSIFRIKLSHDIKFSLYMDLSVFLFLFLEMSERKRQ
jgi:hypothetical protein